MSAVLSISKVSPRRLIKFHWRKTEPSPLIGVLYNIICVYEREVSVCVTAELTVEFNGVTVGRMIYSGRSNDYVTITSYLKTNNEMRWDFTIYFKLQLSKAYTHNMS